MSGVCTHPDYRERGLAGALSAAVATSIRARGATPFLHAYSSNTPAIDCTNDSASACVARSTSPHCSDVRLNRLRAANVRTDATPWLANKRDRRHRLHSTAPENTLISNRCLRTHRAQPHHPPSTDWSERSMSASAIACSRLPAPQSLAAASKISSARRPARWPIFPERVASHEHTISVVDRRDRPVRMPQDPLDDFVVATCRRPTA